MFRQNNGWTMSTMNRVVKHSWPSICLKKILESSDEATLFLWHEIDQQIRMQIRIIPNIDDQQTAIVATWFKTYLEVFRPLVESMLRQIATLRQLEIFLHATRKRTYDFWHIRVIVHWEILRM